jgi:DNA polymerase-4
MPHPRVVLHADMDAFYASVEQRDRPELRGRPVIVGGTSTRGVVTAASYEARAFGVRSAMPSAEAHRLCPDAVFLPGDMQKYARESKRIFAVFARCAPAVEALSLDEAFLDLTGCERLLGPPADVGARLRAEVRRETGLAVSVGIAPVKLVAKIASDLAKPDGLLEVRAGAVREFLAPLPVWRLPGVGPVAEERLRLAGLTHIGQLAAADPERLRARFGDAAAGLARLARGEDVREVEPWRAAVSYSEEGTFARDVRDRAVLAATAREHAEAVARRLRHDGLVARTVVLKLKLAQRVAPGPRGYPILTRRTTLREPSDDGAVLAAAARGLLSRAAPGDAVRLLGVGVTGISRADGGQLPLFAPPDARLRRTRLNRALDELARRFGSDAIHRADQREPERAGLTLARKRGAEEE